MQIWSGLFDDVKPVERTGDAGGGVLGRLNQPKPVFGKPEELFLSAKRTDRSACWRHSAALLRNRSASPCPW